MPKNVLTLPVHVKPRQGRSFARKIARLPNLQRAENVSADIPDVGTEVSSTNAQRMKVVGIQREV